MQWALCFTFSHEWPASAILDMWNELTVRGTLELHGSHLLMPIALWKTLVMRVRHVRTTRALYEQSTDCGTLLKRMQQPSLAFQPASSAKSQIKQVPRPAAPWKCVLGLLNYSLGFSKLLACIIQTAPWKLSQLKSKSMGFYKDWTPPNWLKGNDM